MFLSSLGKKMRQLIKGDEAPKNDTYTSTGDEIGIYATVDDINNDTPYMTVFLNKPQTRVGMRLRAGKYRPVVYIDSRVLPKLISALTVLSERLNNDDAR